MAHWEIKHRTAGEQVRVDAIVAALTRARIGEGPNIPAGDLVDLVAAIRNHAIEGLVMDPKNFSEITVATLIADVDWPADLDEGPNGIRVACIQVGLKTVGDLVVLGDRPMKRAKLAQALGDSGERLRVQRLEAIDTIVRIARNNAKAADAAMKALAPATLHKPSKCVDGLSVDASPEEPPEDPVLVYRQSAPVMPRTGRETERTKRKLNRMDLALEMFRDGYTVEKTASMVGCSVVNITNNWPANSRFCHLRDLAREAHRRWGPRPGYNGAPDELVKQAPRTPESPQDEKQGVDAARNKSDENEAWDGTFPDKVAPIDDRPVMRPARVQEFRMDRDGKATPYGDPSPLRPGYEPADFQFERSGPLNATAQGVLAKIPVGVTDEEVIPRVEEWVRGMGEAQAGYNAHFDAAIDKAAAAATNIPSWDKEPGQVQDALNADFSNYVHGTDEPEGLEDPTDPAPALCVVDEDGTLHDVPIHPRLAREIYRLWDSGLFGATRADTVAYLVSMAIRDLLS